MYKETLTAILDVLNTIEVNGGTGFAKEAKQDKFVRKANTPRIADINLPIITVELLDSKEDAERWKPDDYLVIDSTSLSDSAVTIDYPKPILLTVQIELIAKRKHDMIEMRKGMDKAIGLAKDLDITWDFGGGYSVTMSCHMHLVGEARHYVDVTGNEFDSRIVYQYNVESWDFDDSTFGESSIVLDRTLKRGHFGSDDVDETLDLDA